MQFSIGWVVRGQWGQGVQQGGGLLVWDIQEREIRGGRAGVQRLVRGEERVVLIVVGLLDYLRGDREGCKVGGGRKVSQVFEGVLE